MHKVDERIRAELMKHFLERTPVLHLLELLILGPGPKVPRGSTKKAETMKAARELLELAYSSGLDRGYDLGASVFLGASVSGGED